MSQTTLLIDPAALRDRFDDVEVVDVRTAGEFESVHLPKARNHPLDRLDDHLDEIRELVDDGRDVVLICQTGVRSQQAQARLADSGLDELAVVDGGVAAWQAQGGDVVRGVIRWDLFRQVRMVAGSLVAGSVAVSIVWPPARFVAGAVGLGLVYSALSNSCAMANVLAKLPYNRPRTTS